MVSVLIIQKKLGDSLGCPFWGGRSAVSHFFWVDSLANLGGNHPCHEIFHTKSSNLGEPVARYYI